MGLRELVRLEIEHFSYIKALLHGNNVLLIGHCVQIVQYMQKIYNSSPNLSLLSHKLTTNVSQVSLREAHYALR